MPALKHKPLVAIAAVNIALFINLKPYARMAEGGGGLARAVTFHAS